MNFVLPVAKLGNGGVILVLFETPFGFALFGHDGCNLFKQDAIHVPSIAPFSFVLCLFPIFVIDLIFSHILHVMQNRYLVRVCQGFYGTT